MKADYRCPWCGCGIEDPEWWDNWSQDYEAECPECERRFGVLVETEPVFNVQMPRELDGCGECYAWVLDMDGYCGHGEGLRCSLDGCPLGYEREGEER